MYVRRSARVVPRHLGRRGPREDASEGRERRDRAYLSPPPRARSLSVGRVGTSRLMHCVSFAPQCLSGRGDKDVEQISQLLPGKWEEKLDWYISSTPGEQQKTQ